jgi:hypothetical protein
MVGPIGMGVADLIAMDPSATWNTSTNSVANTCAPACAPFSPRIVPITVFDLDEFQWRKATNDWTTNWIPGGNGTAGSPGAPGFSCPIGGKCVRVANIIGFFVVGMTGNDVRGRIAMYPGEFVTGPPSVTTAAAFLTSIQLIR